MDNCLLTSLVELDTFPDVRELKYMTDDDLFYFYKQKKASAFIYSADGEQSHIKISAPRPKLMVMMLLGNWKTFLHQKKVESIVD